MSIFTFFMLFAAVFLLFLLLPDIYPRCLCCGEKKLRMFFKIHEPTGLTPGYGSNKSICKKCSRKYEIDDLDGYYRFDHIRRKVVIDFSKVRESRDIPTSLEKRTSHRKSTRS